MRTLIAVLLIISTGQMLVGQTCLHTNLSKTFNFETNIERLENSEKYADCCIVTVMVSSNETEKTVQRIRFNSDYLFESAFTDCNFVRSYTTGINKSASIADNDYGDLVIADLNFDNKEDIAVKSIAGDNGGPFYNFYFQKNDTFMMDFFLTRQMLHFPTEINKWRQTLTTYSHANAYEYGKTTYKFNSSNGDWKRIYHQQFPYDPEHPVPVETKEANPIENAPTGEPANEIEHPFRILDWIGGALWILMFLTPLITFPLIWKVSSGNEFVKIAVAFTLALLLSYGLYWASLLIIFRNGMAG